MIEEHDSKSKVISQGVTALIDQLKNDGVKAGQQEAERIIKRAHDQANTILNEARVEAKTLVDDSYKKIQQEKRAAEDALRLAARNMRLELRQHFIDRFKEEVKRLVHKELSNEDTMHQLILILTLDTAEQMRQIKSKKINIELPSTVLDFEEIRKNPQLLEKDPLKELTQGITNQMLKEGVHLKVNTHNQREVGIKIKFIDEKVEMDLTETAISELLLKHIQPRFRALLEGLLQ